MIPGTAAPTVKEIPYDYVARFVLNGKKPGNRVPDVINISTEGAFVAVAIGYSFIPSKLKLPAPFLERVITPGPTPQGVPGVSRLTNPNAPLEFPVSLIDVMAQTVARLLGFAASANQDNIRNQLILATQSLADLQGFQFLLAKVCGIDFKYSIVDSGSGRELQNLAIHNIAGLGESSGERPFRPMAKPMLFMPRSTIRVEIEEVSQGQLYENAELFIVLHGYKMLGYGTG
jgi:hypothetical protein